MKNIAICITLMVLLSFFVEPLVETANVYREKIIVGSAISNSCRAAKDRSLEDERLRELDAKVDSDLFMEYFADAFSNSMNMTLDNESGTILTFSSNDGKYNDFTVTLDFSNETDFSTEQLTSEVDIKAESQYKFKTNYLKIAEDAGQDTAFKIVSKRKLILSVKN